LKQLLKEEIAVMKDKIEHHPDVTRFAMENLELRGNSSSSHSRGGGRVRGRETGRKGGGKREKKGELRNMHYALCNISQSKKYKER